MYIKLENDFKVNREANPTAPTNKELSLNWIETAIAYGYKNGLPSDKRRIFSGIVGKIDATKKSSADYLEVNDYELIFIKNALALVVCSPQETIAITTVEDAVNAAVTEVPVADAASENAPVPPVEATLAE